MTNFADQWLYLRNLAAATPDPRMFPDFDDNLREAIRRETELFFESIVSEDRSVLDLLSANYTFLNERLARHYGIPNVVRQPTSGASTLADDSPRGGLLGQGSILTVTSYAEPDVAGAARQVDPRKHSRHAAAAAAAQRAAAAGDEQPAARRVCRCASAWCSIAPIRPAQAAIS